MLSLKFRRLFFKIIFLIQEVRIFLEIPQFNREQFDF